jgi:hypothetical protein
MIFLMFVCSNIKNQEAKPQALASQDMVVATNQI